MLKVARKRCEARQVPDLPRSPTGTSRCSRYRCNRYWDIPGCNGFPTRIYVLVARNFVSGPWLAHSPQFRSSKFSIFLQWTGNEQKYFALLPIVAHLGYKFLVFVQMLDVILQRCRKIRRRVLRILRVFFFIFIPRSVWGSIILQLTSKDKTWISRNEIQNCSKFIYRDSKNFNWSFFFFYFRC